VAFKETWASEPTYGALCSIPSGYTVELMAYAGFDWLYIDLEHGAAETADLIPMLQAASINRMPTFVRVPWNDPGVIMRALDSGAAGVVVPMVSDAEQAKRAAGACRYPPDGYRSWGPLRAALGVPDYTPKVGNASVICVVMIETVEGAERVDEIVSVPGVDGVFIGVADLALSAGLPPALDSRVPEHVARIERIIASCNKHGKVVGTFSGLDTRRWLDLGMRMLMVAGDAGQISSGARQAIDAAKESARSSGGVAKHS